MNKTYSLSSKNWGANMGRGGWIMETNSSKGIGQLYKMSKEKTNRVENTQGRNYNSKYYLQGCTVYVPLIKQLRDFHY